MRNLVFLLIISLFSLHSFGLQSNSNLPIKDKLDIIDLNSIKILAPDGFNFRTIGEMFKETMTSTKEEFGSYFLDGEGHTDHACEQDPCIRCGGTGKEPKRYSFDNNNFDGIDKELNVH